MSHNWLRTIAVHGCRGLGALSVAERANRDRLTVLTYHRILPPDRRQAYFNPGLAVTPEAFRTHCRVLRERFEVLPLGEAVERWGRGCTASRPLAAITFDDGYRDNFRLAAPVLAEFGLRATFFVVVGLVGSRQLLWHDRLARVIGTLRDDQRPDSGAGSQDQPNPAQVVRAAKSLDPSQRRTLIEQLEAQSVPVPICDDDLIMDWGQLCALKAAGHEIGSHTSTHEILPLLGDAELEQEVAGSRRVLEERLSIGVGAFCYPNGDLDARVVEAVVATGYTCAATTVEGINSRGQDPHRLSRRFIHQDRLTGRGETTPPLLLRAELCGLADQVFGRRWRSS